MRCARQAGLALVLLVATAGTAAAHQVGGSRFDAPIPLPLLFAGAGATIAVTAGWLAASPGDAPVGESRRRLASVDPHVARSIELASSVAFLLLFVLAVGHGLLGPAVAAENFATVFVWPLWLKGVALLAAAIGSPWRVLSPWRTVHRGLEWLERGDVAVLGAYPSRFREWPALVGFVVWIGVLENLTVVPRSPRATTVLIAGYAGVMLFGGIAFGDEWFERADALSVLYRLLGRVAPVEIARTPSGGRTIALRAPWEACARAVRTLPLVAFVIATVYTVSFDGFTSAPEYQVVLFAARDATGIGPGASVLLYLGGLALFCGSFAAVARLADAAGGRDGLGSALLAFAPTVLPIAVAYEIAHNYPYVARNVGQLAVVVGQYAAATPVPVDPLAWLSLPVFWGSQVLLVIAGHVVAVAAAHRVAIRRYPDRRAAIRAHAPITALMVGYTVLSLWIVSRPVVS